MRRSKYGAQRTVVDGITFASKRESQRYSALKLLARAGQIQNLTLQPRFPLRVNDQLVTTYVGDFLYQEDGTRVVEDAKGFRTPEYKIKAKLFAAIYGYAVREV